MNLKNRKVLMVTVGLMLLCVCIVCFASRSTLIFVGNSYENSQDINTIISLLFDLQAIKGLLLYSKRDLNPHSRNGQGILSPSCLPIPPFEHPRRERAENETRTRDPNLGKVMLYQLSYFRVLFDGCKDKEFYNIYQILHPFFYLRT